MSDRESHYVSPFETRYASESMQKLFGARKKFTTWRRLWLALAESQKFLGMDITDEQIAEMSQHLDDIDFSVAAKYEKEFRHDVMAHIHAYGDAAPKARRIIHLGATSQFVGCNCDLIIMREALGILTGRLANIVNSLAKFAHDHRDLACLGFTHFQPAQLTTVGKRASLWCADFVRDLEELEYRSANLEFRGVKGTTGTQASFLSLFDGDHAKVTALEAMVAKKMGFAKTCCVTGQTYSRKVDAGIAATLGSFAASVHKFCNDVRLMAHRKEMEEPFAKGQIGSSAMAYKRNPMRSERATAIARFLMDVAASPLHTFAEQWLERTLDDSANKRLAMSEAFLAADSISLITLNIVQGLVTYPATIAAGIAEELPFMATENILMAAVKSGGDRQDLHEKIRRHSMAAATQVKEKGLPNDLMERLEGDPAFSSLDFGKLMDPAAFIGRAPQQVDEFVSTVVEPIRKRYQDQLGQKGELAV